MLKRVALLSTGAVVAAFAVLFAVLPVPGPAPSGSAAANGSNSFVIEDVRVFDGATLHPPTTLVVVAGKVVGFGDAVGRPPRLPVIDGHGKTVLPGLFDAHTHAWGPAQQDALRFGVTTMLDMFTSTTAIAGMAAQRDSDARSDRAALFSAGMLATTDGGHGTQFGVPLDTLSGPEEAAGWVAARRAEGSDYIKIVYMPDSSRLPSIDLATASAVIDAAHAQGLKAVAHIASASAAQALVNAGIDGFVHVFADEPASDALIAQMRDAQVFVIPTLAVIAMADGRAPGTEALVDADLAPLLTDAQKTNLKADAGGQVPGFSLAIALDNVGRLHAAGVPILAGSDAPNPGTAQGVTLHQELELLTRAGLRPQAALAAATSVPAKWFGAHGRGVIAAGARADLVLVRGNPLDDVRATRAIDSVFRNGFVVGRTPQAATGASASALPAELGDFDSGIDLLDGLAWSATSDEYMGGRSTAVIAWHDAGADASGGALRVRVSVVQQFRFPWAGAFLAVTPAGSAASALGFSALEFDLRGTPADYRAMLFSAGMSGAPPTRSFAANGNWSRVRLALDDFVGADLGQLTGIALVAPMQPGDYEFDIDRVRLVR